MKFQYIENQKLPCLAWVASCKTGCDTIKVIHGEKVEVHDNFFVEGAWSGEFSAGGFDQADCFFGTGGNISKENHAVFAAPSSTTDALFYGCGANITYVSNSLSFLLAARNDFLLPDFDQYNKINQSIQYGFHDYMSEIPTVTGSVFRIIFNNVVFYQNNGLTVCDKLQTSGFTNFTEYKKYLYAQVGKLIENARDSKRSEPMSIFSTQSKGYDTTAVNAIASSFGINEIFTIKESKGKGCFAEQDEGLQEDDCGSEIADLLGIKCTEISRRDYLTTYSYEELFFSGLHDPQDTNMVGIFPHVKGSTLLLTGIFGEIWYRLDTLKSHRDSPLNADLSKWDLGGHSLSEVRLDVGFVQAAIPFIGGRHKLDIATITESSEMASWRLNNSYDRPIPRRFAEEAGIPREAFGQKKMASVMEFAKPRMPLNSDLLTEYVSWLKKNKIVSSLIITLIPFIQTINSEITFATSRRSNDIRFIVVYYTNRIVSLLLRRVWAFPVFMNRLNSSIFCFFVNRKTDKYHNIIDDNLIDLDRD